MKKRKQRSWPAIVSVILLGAIIFYAVSYAWNTTTSVFQPANPNDKNAVSFAVAPGDTTAQIGEKLYQSGLIRDPLAFRVWARIKGLDTRLQAGVYNKLTPSMTISQIIDQLLDAQPDATRVVVPEGMRLEQIVKQFSTAQPKLVKFKADEFLNYTKHIDTFPDAAKYPILKDVPKGRSMEGLLFPATYDIPVNGTARDTVNKLLTITQNVVNDDADTLKGLGVNQPLHLNKARQLNVYQAFILASLVEREVVHDEDRAGVASVYWNRILRPNNETVGLLNSDPSVQYARDSLKAPTSYWKDLEDSGGLVAPDSIWNTYTHKGWPPTPICSPGLASLKAAAQPPQSDNYFFLGKKDGHIVYAKNKADFDKLVQQYLGK